MAASRTYQSASIFSNGSAYSRQNPTDDHNPLANLLNFEDISTDLEKAGGLIKGVIDGVLDGVIEFIEEATGLDLSGLEPIIDSLTSGLDLITDALSALTSGDPAQLLEFFTNLSSLDILTTFPNILGALDGIDLSSPGGILAAIATALEGVPLLGPFVEALTGSTGDLTDLTSWATNLLNGGSPLDAFNLFNLIPSNLLGMIPYSIIGDATHENLLTNGGFEGAVSVQGNGIWSWDAVNGRTTPGCVSVTANGSEQRLLSNAFPVAAGDKLPHIIYAQWAGLVYTGTPFRTRMVRLLNHAQVGVDNLTSPTGLTGTQTGWGYALSGDYTVPAGCDEVCYELTINASCTAGTIKFDDGWVYKDNLLQIPWTEDLPDSLQDLLDGAQATLDAIFEGITSVSGVGTLLADVIAALQQIPFLNVLGVGGPGDIGGSIQSTWDQWIGGLVGAVGSGASLADLFNIGQDISSRATLGSFSWDILGIRSNKSLNTGFLPTTQSNIPLSTVSTGASMTTVPITQSTALTAYQRISESMSLGVVSWQGQGVTSVTDCYVNVYKMNTSTGLNTLVHASTNQIGLLSGTMAPVVYSIPTPINVLPGEVYGFEIAIRGAGTHNVAGGASALPDQTVYPRRLSSVRNSGVSAAPSTFTPTYGTNVPFIEFGVSAGDVAIPHTPTITQFADAGSPTFPIPSWANVVQIAAVGGGGAGRQGGTYGISGEGGENGDWNTIEWTRGTHFDAASAPSLAIVIPAKAQGGGDSGTSGGVGNNGGSVTVTLPATTGHSSATLTATGGEGGDALNAGGSDKQGQSPGNQVLDGVTYVGGAAQNTFGGAGADAGGGGAGGNYVSFQLGGKGGLGRAWVRLKQ
jgi:hypothetical protein